MRPFADESGTAVIRIGVIGAGDVAARDYLPAAVHRLGSAASIVAIASSDGVRARHLADRYEIPHAHAGFETILADRSIDAIVNLTPTSMHDAVNRATVAAGKHLYTEKPAALTAERIRTLAAAARLAGVTVAAAPSVMVFPQVQRARALVEAESIGQVWTATGQFIGGIPPWVGYESDPTPFFSSSVGPLVDVGIYPLHALTGLLGPVSRVTALSHRSRPSFVQRDGPAAGVKVKVEVDDVWHLIVQLHSGAIVTVRSDFASLGATSAADVELNGENGSICLSLMDMAAPLRIQVDGDDDFREESFPNARAEGPDHVLGVVHLVECLTNGRTLELSLEHAAHVVDVLEAAARSATTGQTEEIASSFDPPQLQGAL